MAERCALITGIQGFCGRHLSVHLAEQGYAVHGLDRFSDPPVPGAAVVAGDIRDLGVVQEVLRTVRPTHLFHLAALTAPQADWETLHDVNVRGTDRLLEAVRLSGLDPVVLVTGSSAAYGRVAAEELPISESQPFRPMTLYAVSKIAQEMLAYAYHARYGMRMIRARAFNLTGPGEGAGFVTSAFAWQIAEIEAGRREPVLRVGNLETVRDFTDVRDTVRAYRLMAECGEPGAVYNVCSGTGTPVRQLLDTLLQLSRVREIRVDVDPARLQPADVPVQVGDASLLREVTGWTPVLPLDQTLHDVLHYWRSQSPKRR